MRKTAIAILLSATGFAGSSLVPAVAWAGATSAYVGATSANRSTTEHIGKAAHKYATFIIARRSQLSLARSHRLSFFSQLPDDEYCLNALTAGVQAFRIRDTIHSLHGGNGRVVLHRQSDLRSLLKHGTNGRALNDLQMGLVLHALSDSYAHTFIIKGKVYAYEPVFGHARDSILAELSSTTKDPDLIAHFPGKFKRYACDLYRTLTKGRNSCRRRLRRLNALVDNLSRRVGDELAQMRALALLYGFNDWQYHKLGLKHGITGQHTGNPLPGCASKIRLKDLFNVMRMMERKFAG